MSQDRFDFTLARQGWRWARRVGESVVARSADAFTTLGECLADARRSGLHPRSACSGCSFHESAAAAGH